MAMKNIALAHEAMWNITFAHDAMWKIALAHDVNVELVDDAMDAMRETKIEIKKTQEKIDKLYDFCGEVPLDDVCNY